MNNKQQHTAPPPHPHHDAPAHPNTNTLAPTRSNPPIRPRHNHHHPQAIPTEPPATIRGNTSAPDHTIPQRATT
eukprot:4891302-Alexandrium_andersonii.AAC.1